MKLPISPLVGEMPGRAEGGAKVRGLGSMRTHMHRLGVSWRRWRDSAPSGLPAISPTWGEIGSFAASPFPSHQGTHTP